MPNYEDKINNQLLDRLVDGELSDADYRITLHRLDEAPDGWRRCAMSFLEQQALRQELQQLLNNQTRLNPLEDCDLDKASLSEVEGADELHFAATRHDWERWFRQPWVRWTSVLAVGILAFVGGLALRPFASPPTKGDQLVARNQRAIGQPPAVANSRHAANSAEIASITFDDMPNNQSQRLQVPFELVSQSNGTPTLAPDRLPPKFERIFTETNAANQLERRIIMGRTQNGEVILVPLDRIVHRVNFQ